MPSIAARRASAEWHRRSRFRSPCRPHGTCLKWIRCDATLPRRRRAAETGVPGLPGRGETNALRRSRDIRVEHDRRRGRGPTLPPAMVPAAPGRRRFFRRPRITFAARLLLGGFVLSLAIIAAVSAFLLVSRDQQTQGGRRDQRARAGRRPTASWCSRWPRPRPASPPRTSPGCPRWRPRSASADPQTAVAALLTGSTKVITDLPDETVAVFDADGTLLATSEQAGRAPALLRSARGGGALRRQPRRGHRLPRRPNPGLRLRRTGHGPGVDPGARRGRLQHADHRPAAPAARCRRRRATPRCIIANQPGAPLYAALRATRPTPALTARPLPASIGTDLGRSAGSFAGFSTVPDPATPPSPWRG